MIAANKLTNDSNASEKKPIEPVSKYAANFNPMVVNAAAIERYRNLFREGDFIVS